MRGYTRSSRQPPSSSGTSSALSHSPLSAQQGNYNSCCSPGGGGGGRHAATSVLRPAPHWAVVSSTVHTQTGRGRTLAVPTVPAKKTDSTAHTRPSISGFPAHCGRMASLPLSDDEAEGRGRWAVNSITCCSSQRSSFEHLDCYSSLRSSFEHMAFFGCCCCSSSSSLL